MKSIFETHIGLIEKVNNSETYEAHNLAVAELIGFRTALELVGQRLNVVGCDNYYLDQGIDRPMCCGVWIDWVPASAKNYQGEE